MGVAEEAEKTVTGTVDALKFQPVLLVIVLLNCRKAGFTEPWA